MGLLDGMNQMKTAVDTMAATYGKTGTAALPVFVQSSTITSQKSIVSACSLDAKCSTTVNIDVIAEYDVGDLVLQSLHDNVISVANAINAAYCSCDCNYSCTCNCNYCTCDCHRCSCNCDRCSCDCDDCTCNCDHCTCNCDHTCSCDCDNCSCDCNYCTCACNNSSSCSSEDDW